MLGLFFGGGFSYVAIRWLSDDAFVFFALAFAEGLGFFSGPAFLWGDRTLRQGSGWCDSSVRCDDVIVGGWTFNSPM